MNSDKKSVRCPICSDDYLEDKMAHPGQYLYTSHYVCVTSKCAEHGEHSLSVTTKNKGGLSAFIKDIAQDIPFYNDSCELGSTEGIYIGHQDFYKITDAKGRSITVSGGLTRLDKSMYTKGKT